MENIDPLKLAFILLSRVCVEGGLGGGGGLRLETVLFVGNIVTLRMDCSTRTETSPTPTPT